MNRKSPALLDPKESEDLNPEVTAPQRHHTAIRWWIWLLMLVILGALAYRWYQRPHGQQSPGQRATGRGPQTIPVMVASAHRGEMSVWLNGLGTVTAFNTVTVRSRVDGQLEQVAFREGQFVRQGDLLAQIDPRPFQVQLAQAEGALARDQAQLNNAKVDLERYRTLLEQDSIPKQQLDTQAAVVGQMEGAIQADQAQIESAKLQLSYSRILAPISGRVGLRLVDAGNIVRASDPNGLLVITQVHPIAVLFTIPQDNLPPVLQKLKSGSRLMVEAYDRSGSTRIARGELVTVDNQIDVATGTSRLKSVFSNPDDVLFPNQFVNVRLLLDVKRNALIIPVVAVQRGPQGVFVYVVKEGETVEVRPVTLGLTEGDMTSIEQGLKEGESVVVDGADKLQSGSRVRITDPGHRQRGSARKS
jgi:RND family efflux transporter, MFP subunit